MGNTIAMFQPAKRNALPIGHLLKPHAKALAIGLLAVIGEGITNLLEPWPLKIVLDNVLRTRPMSGWLNGLIPGKMGPWI